LNWLASQKFDIAEHRIVFEELMEAIRQAQGGSSGSKRRRRGHRGGLMRGAKQFVNPTRNIVWVRGRVISNHRLKIAGGHSATQIAAAECR
jgi:hypothetical protein